MTIHLVNQCNWDKSNGLLPAIIQHRDTGQVLMLGYMNKAALQQTLDTQHVTFYSRSRQSIWIKGETSGHYLLCDRVLLDCDQDSLLVLATPLGPTCHKGTTSCFDNDTMTWQSLQALELVIQQRDEQRPVTSYTTTLLSSGINKIAQKVGEEAVETVVAGLKESDERVCSEMADLLYHLLVLLRARRLSVDDVFSELSNR